jgi:hypothetical protein
MSPNLSDLFRRSAVGMTVAAALLAWAPPTQARVTRIIIDTTTSPAFGGAVFGSAGSVGQYETLAGRAFGELDPDHRLNEIIQDIELAKDPDGKVRYMATFFLVKPINMSNSSGLMWHDVPNRGGRITISTDLRNFGDVGLSSGWQGDNSGNTAHDRPGREIVVVPIAKNPDGSSITGRVMGRILNASGVNSQPIIVHSNPLPYKPATLDTRQATLTVIESETIEGKVDPSRVVQSADWAWASCSASNPFPGTPDPTQICVRGGFEPNRAYQVVFTAKDPYVLGVGFAAFRDVGSFFRYQTQDDVGTLNPVAGGITWVIGRGSSQSGNFLRAFLHLGFNQNEDRRQVHDGSWPIIAGRRVALNFRFAMPDGVLKLYEPGSEGPQWWVRWPDRVRHLPTRGILDRCSATLTCPKIIEHFGAAEIWGLKLGPEWVGTDASTDIPLPKNVRRYYIPSTEHGGGDGGFDTVNLPAVPSCPSAGYGQGTFRGNPVPHTQTVLALRVHFRNWVMKGTLPPPSRWPTLRPLNDDDRMDDDHRKGHHGKGQDRHDRDGRDDWDDRDDRHRWHRGHDRHDRFSLLVDATKRDMGFPTIPGVPATAPTGLINPVLDYDFGREFDYSNASGIQTVIPPRIKQVIRMLVPRVDADGNELGGVPIVLRDAPLGTYLGWNITAAGFHKGKICNYAGGMIPFATTKAERLANRDPRLSLQERYGTREGYVRAVRAAADNAVAQGFLLPADADALVAAAAASNVLFPPPPGP